MIASRALVTLLVAVLGATVSQVSATPLIRSVLQQVCVAGWSAGEASFAELERIEVEPLKLNERVIGERSRWEDSQGGELRIVRVAPGQRLQRVGIETGERTPQSLRPVLSVQVDAQCRILDARRLTYAADGSSVEIQVLDTDLATVIERQALDAPVPQGPRSAGVMVAMVDSGINYTLGKFTGSLARDPNGRLIGYDFWDLDERPFDSNPAGSPFYPQRHGTQTASLLVTESQVARVAPYRYPRPDMSRMAEVVAHAARHDIRIMNLSLGSRRREDWAAFERTARANPQMLFVVSAGNDGRDLDREPIYPAAFEIDNLITVTSVDDFGRPAPGSSWGAETVDIGVPAENVIVSDFNGRARLASGSSYAAARISALAACLLSANPDWTTLDLKSAIFALTDEDKDLSEGMLAAGVLGDPDIVDRGACPASRSTTELRGARTLLVDGEETGLEHRLELGVVLVEGTGWRTDEVAPLARAASGILAQCGVRIPQVAVQSLATPDPLKYFTTYSAHRLVEAHRFAGATVYLLEDTLRDQRYDAEAIGRSNSRGRSDLIDTVWMTRAIEPAGVSLAHELVHLLIDSGEHADDPTNLMHADVTAASTRLTDRQCRQIRERGVHNGLLQLTRG